MAAPIRVTEFKGMAPRISARNLQHSAAQVAKNCDLWSSELRGLRNSLVANTPTKTGPLLSIFPLGGKWLGWTTDVDVVPAPLSISQSGRFYYTGDGQPKSSDTDLATVGAGTDYPLASYKLGLPPPDDAPTVAATGGTATDVTRSYCMTFVTAWGEEGPPSPVSADVTGPSDATWNLTALDVAPPNSGTVTGATSASGVVTVTTAANHFLETGDYVTIAGVAGMTDLNGDWQVTRADATHFTVVLNSSQAYTSGGTWTRDAPIQTSGMTKRIYRTLNGAYTYVDEIAVATTSYADTVADADLGESIPGGITSSTWWQSPPADIQGLIALPNGVLAAFYDNVLCFSEVYVPHAWPTGYQLTFPDPIVAIAKVGSIIVVMTQGRPYVIGITDPGSMVPTQLEIRQACISKRGVAVLKSGVVYPGPDGLVYVPASGLPEVITGGLAKKSEWDAYNPSSFTGTSYDDRWYGFYSGAGSAGTDSGCVVFDPTEADVALIELDIGADAAYLDESTDSMYYYYDGSIYQWREGGGYLSFEWKSKKFVTERPTKLAAGLVRFDVDGGVTSSQYDAAVAAANAAIDSKVALGDITSFGCFGGFTCGEFTVDGGPYADAAASVGAPATAILNVYANGELVVAKQLTNNPNDVVVQSEREFGVTDGSTLDFDLLSSSSASIGAVKSAVVYLKDWQGRQLLYDTPRTSIFAYNSDLTNAAWIKQYTSVTLSGSIGPDGINESFLISDVVSTTNTQHNLYQTPTLTVGDTYYLSGDFMAGSNPGVLLQCWNATYGHFATAEFDLINGVVLSVTAGTALIMELPDTGWYRCIVYGDANGSTGNYIAARLLNTSYSDFYVADGTGNILARAVWFADGPGAFVETGASPITVTDYILNGSIVQLSSPHDAGGILTWTGEYTYFDNVAKPFRIPPLGRLATEFEFSLTGNNIHVHEVVLAESKSDIARLMASA